MYFPDGEQHKQPKHGIRFRASKKTLVIWLCAFALVVGSGSVLYSNGFIKSLVSPTTDYEGSTGAIVEFTIAEGDSGELIAENLATAKIIKSFKTFYQLVLSSEPAPTFMPGVYAMKENMSAKDALAALLDPNNRLEDKVVIPEGTILPKVISLLSKSTGLPASDFETAIKNPQSLGLPAEARTVEGFLFPATYNFSPNQSAADIIEQMIQRSFKALDEAKVPAADRFKVITLASLIQKEAGSAADMYKVSRVFQNRLIEDMWPTGLLESDATVAYGSGHTDRWNTTDAERADRTNIYNTYVHPGPLAAPISNPGDDAIDAALHPVDGKWLFFVAVNLETGETVFSNDLAGHEAAVAQSQAWWQAHPEYE